MAKTDLTAQLLRELLHYNPKTGTFTRLVAAPRAPVGSVAGADSHGYRAVMVDGKTYRCHRLAWLYITGEWPKKCIDHINGDRADNRFLNLRDVPHKTNLQNERTARRNSSSGLLGAHRTRDRWFSRIRVDGVYRYLGRFDSAEEAHAAYIAAKRLLHGGCTV